MCEVEKPLTKNIKTRQVYRTPRNADSVEWCPHKPFQNIFVCANYQLIKEENGSSKRFGNILLFQWLDDDLKLLQTLETSAVLDQKWCHNQIEDRSILGVVNASNTLEIYSLNPETIQLEQILKTTVNNNSEEVLLLSLDWSTGKYENCPLVIICSDSKGDIHRFQFQNNDLILLDTYHGHSYEAWIAGFYYWDPNVFFTGGDDSYFLKFDVRVGLQPIAKNRSHEAGVTSMHCNVEEEFILASGSYDANIRLWDIRNMKSYSKKVETPGPLWRLKWEPFKANYLLAASMLGGAHVTNKNLEIVDSYYEHENICYGADWAHMENEKFKTIASCSFYDNKLCVWTLENENSAQT